MGDRDLPEDSRRVTLGEIITIVVMTVIVFALALSLCSCKTQPTRTITITEPVPYPVPAEPISLEPVEKPVCPEVGDDEPIEEVVGKLILCIQMLLGWGEEQDVKIRSTHDSGTSPAPTR